MPLLIFHAFNPSRLELNCATCRLEGHRLTDGSKTLAEYNGSFWVNDEGSFTGIGFTGTKSIRLECKQGPARSLDPQLDVSLAGHALWNGRSCAAVLKDAHWVDNSTGESVAAIVLKD